MSLDFHSDHRTHVLMGASSRITHHVRKLKSSQPGFNEFAVLKWSPQSPDLSPAERLWDVVEQEICIIDMQPTNLQQLHDAIMLIWTKISEKCFQHLVESTPQRIEAVLKAKGVKPSTSKVYLKKWLVSIYSRQETSPTGAYTYINTCLCTHTYLL